MVTNKFSEVDLSNKYFIRDDADLPAPITRIFLIFDACCKYHTKVMNCYILQNNLTLMSLFNSIQFGIFAINNTSWKRKF